MVWMRPAAMSNFHKLYGIIEDDIESGTEITFRVTSRYPVTSFHGTKTLVLMSHDGTKGHNLPIAFFVIGPYCLIVAALILLKQYKCPRVSGSIAIINDWTQHAEGGTKSLYRGQWRDRGSSVERKTTEGEVVYHPAPSPEVSRSS